MEGLEKFKEAFEAFADNYVIIGGTACSIVMTGTAVRPRATHDIDMIVVVEKMTPDFAARFWQFVREAGYRPERRKSVEGQAPKYELYRFLDGKSGYPEMIELLSRHPDILGEPREFIIEPLPVDVRHPASVPLSWPMTSITSLSIIVAYRWPNATSGLAVKNHKMGPQFFKKRNTRYSQLFENC